MKEEVILLPGPCGVLEARYFEGSLTDVGILCHPHPLHQGTMNNKVVTTAIRAWQALGLSTLRFNFRGVGSSQGQYGEGVGEQADLLSVVEWIRKRLPQARLWLGGFSFGSWIALKTSNEVSPAGLITIAPALRLLDFSSLQLPQCPWLIIQGSADELVPLETFEEWAHSIGEKRAVEVEVLEGASHFFHGRLPEIAECIQSFMESLKS